ncbi:MAG: hypothetical protein PVI37_08750 [Gammaproteobacteria bacterium]|jgi:hypothetical protein
MLRRALAGLVAVAFLVVAFIIGAYVLAIVAGLMVIAALAFYLRVWWLRRRMGAGPSAQGRRRDSSVIEGEYVVVDRSSRRRGKEGSDK